MSGWNFADVFETVADVLPRVPALVQGERRLSWAELDLRADAVAAGLLGGGLTHQESVVQYLYNCPEYLESVFAAFKAGLVPVNTNYRYLPEELVALWDDADAAAVVFGSAFARRVEQVRARLPGVRLWLWVDDGSSRSATCPPWALPYEQLAAGAAAGGLKPARVKGPWGRNGDDVWLLYTGGTTGRPKGVRWRQHDLYLAFRGTTITDPVEPDLAAVRRRLVGPGPVHLPACPLMHGAGSSAALHEMVLGACTVLLTGRRFDPVELLDTVARQRVTRVTLVGDAFAAPVLEALDRHPGRWDLSSLRRIVSSGAMWSEANRQGLLRHLPDVELVDAFASSEALGMGRSVSSGKAVRATGSFIPGPGARVVTAEGRDVVPGSGQVGQVVVRGPAPVGYHKDPEATARTFVELDGMRYAVSGDLATVEADGSLRLLGRGSTCINTGGEKVWPEEVEEVLKEHPAVADAAVVGVPEARLGEQVWAWVQPAGGARGEGGAGAAGLAAELVAHVRHRLADYKAPRRVLWTDDLGRTPSGKLDYPRLRQDAIERSGPPDD